MDAEGVRAAVADVLLPGDETVWRNWTERHLRELNDWLLLFELLESAVRDRPDQRRAAAALYLWAVDRAPMPPDDAAITIASFVRRNDQLAGAGVVPSPSAVATRCLDLIDFAAEEIPEVSAGPRSVDLDVLRSSRRARLLVRAAGLHADRITDPAVRERLAWWTARLPRLA